MPIIGREIRRYDCVESTNDLARLLAEQGEAEGLVITAEEQRAGRGRFGRRWIAPRGTSIQLSVLLRPPLPLSRVWQITQIAALAVAQTLREELGLAPILKWPNDVLLAPRRDAPFLKVAGILTETSVQGDRPVYVILGIGLNVNFTMRDFPALAPSATTLADVLGHETDRAALERALLTALDVYYMRLCAGIDLGAEYRAAMPMLGQYVQVATASGIVAGIAEDVEADGALRIRQDDKILHVYAGEVTMVKEVQ